MSIIRYLFWIPFLFVALQSCSKEDTTFTLEDANAFESSIKGTVMSRKEKPLSGVLIVANPGGYTTVSSIDGSYSFSQIKAGKYVVQYIKEDYRDTLVSDSIDVGLRDKQEANPVKLQYRYAGIKGNVSDNAGDPLIGAGVVVEDQEGGVLSQSEGKFSLAKVEPGKVRLFSVVQGKGYGYTDIDLVADSIYQDIEVRLDKRGGVVKGSVVDKAGNPLSGVGISAYQGALAAETGSNGSFSMNEVPRIGDNRMQIASGDMTTYCGGMYLGMQDTLDIGAIVLEKTVKGDLMIPPSFHMTTIVDTTKLIMPWASSEDSIRPLWFYWSFDNGETWITTLEPRLTVVATAHQWGVGVHEVAVRCMSMDSIESNESVIVVKVQASTETKWNEDTTRYSSAVDTAGKSSVMGASSSGGGIGLSSSSACVNSGLANTVTDCRDGQVYKTVKIGTQTWMAENLNFGKEIVSIDSIQPYNAKSCYADDSLNCKQYGALYRWTTVMNLDTSYQAKEWNGTLPHRGICPDQWHVPEFSEWQTLSTYIDIENDSIENGNATPFMKGTTWSGTDPFKFNALPSGHAGGEKYPTLGLSAFWWTSTESGFYSDVNVAKVFAIDPVNLNWVIGNNFDGKGYGFSLRCVKDDFIPGQDTGAGTIDYSLLTELDTLEAENFCLSDGVIENTMAGYWNSGYLNFANSLNSYANWIFYSKSDSLINMTFRYSNGSAFARSSKILINGVESVASISFPSTTNWTTWDVTSVPVKVVKGRNEMSMVSLDANGGPNLDAIFWKVNMVFDGDCSN